MSCWKTCPGIFNDSLLFSGLSPNFTGYLHPSMPFSYSATCCLSLGHTCRCSVKQTLLLIFISITLHSFHFQDKRDSFSPLCLCPGRYPGWEYPYLLPSEIEPILPDPGEAVFSSMKPPTTAQATVRAPPSSVLCTSVYLNTFFKHRWPQLAMPSFHLVIAHLHNKTADWRSNQFSSVLISPTMLSPRLGSLTS